MQVRVPDAVLLLLCVVAVVQADGPQDNVVEKVRPVPPAGVKVADQDRQRLEQGLVQLQQHIDRLSSSTDPNVKELLPDVEVLQRAVRVAWEFNEFFSADEIAAGHDLLRMGLVRAEQ